MKKRWFEGYGFLTWLEPRDYLDGDWWYVKTVSMDEVELDIVRDSTGSEWRYTII